MWELAYFVFHGSESDFGYRPGLLLASYVTARDYNAVWNEKK